MIVNSISKTIYNFHQDRLSNSREVKNIISRKTEIKFGMIYCTITKQLKAVFPKLLIESLQNSSKNHNRNSWYLFDFIIEYVVMI